MKSNTKIRVCVADDHAILRSGLRMLLSAEADMEFLGEARDGKEAIALVAQKSPDVLVLDITMPNTGGVQALKTLVARHPQTRVVILTMHDDPAYVRSLLGAGAAGYVLKRSVDADLLSAIRAAHQKRMFVDPSLTASLINSEAVKPAKVRKPVLSKREEQVLCLVAGGLTSQQIANRMLISVKTVETYRSRVGRKLDLRDRSDFFRYAVEFGLISTTNPNPAA